MIESCISTELKGAAAKRYAVRNPLTYLVAAFLMSIIGAGGAFHLWPINAILTRVLLVPVVGVAVYYVGLWLGRRHVWLMLDEEGITLSRGGVEQKIRWDQIVRLQEQELAMGFYRYCVTSSQGSFMVIPRFLPGIHSAWVIIGRASQSFLYAKAMECINKGQPVSFGSLDWWPDKLQFKGCTYLGGELYCIERKPWYRSAYYFFHGKKVRKLNLYSVWNRNLFERLMQDAWKVKIVSIGNGWIDPALN